ncbi:pyruvate, phosphate dikinase [candidate division KSB1 bacterium]|nr:MAG: pyruvate, phosphate dikinase [candidate division KSB1 bacterium]
MTEQNQPADKTLWSLQERTKELHCLYRVEELLRDPDADLPSVFRKVIEAIPAGWQHSDHCQAVLTYGGEVYAVNEFQETPWVQHADIQANEGTAGKLSVYYTREFPAADVGPFLNDEIRLITTLADRIGHYIEFRELRRMNRDWQTATTTAEPRKGEWRVVVDLLQRTDQNLYRRLLRKLFVRLRSRGIQEAELLQEKVRGGAHLPTDENRPTPREAVDRIVNMGMDIFEIATKYFDDQELLNWIQNWVQEDRTSFLVTALENHGTTLSEIADAIRRFQHIAAEGVDLSTATEKEVQVALIQRFFTDQLEYINVAKEHVNVGDFYDLLHRIVFPAGSHGKLGGKSAGLFLASRILKRASAEHEILKNVKIPKTWYVTSDGLLTFVTYNDLEELVEHKYHEIDEIRREYDQIVQVFKHSSFTHELVQGLSMALDDFEDRPLIVRSSSLLEDRFGSAFSGKYKSLFLANQGTKKQRLEALMDAIAEVYSSTFGPDPIQYRAERGLLDFREEMGIMIQEVVGTRVGRYFFPAFAGVAFSNNEFRWSPRIRREDGLIRMVPGLGTRAVDRLADDYPILVAPGQPGLRVNITVEEVMRYSPNKMDVINLETNCFETKDVHEIYRELGSDMPWLPIAISICRDNHLQPPDFFTTDLSRDDFCVTFEGLISRTPFMQQVKTILRVLQETLHTPVDTEFASDGKDFYLLQCRPQVYSTESVPTPIPHDIPLEHVVFNADRYVSNGRIPDITHIVYVDPQRYTEVQDLETLQAIGRCVGRLNQLLPKRQFILMGPGRWGSRGDVKLGVSVTYSEIKNTAALIEIARKKGNYVPDLSFGTHFFQDLVESSIRYLPLYPDDPGIIFNERFLLESPNILPDILPEFADLSDTVHVIDVPNSAGGRILRVLMNADLDQAVAMLSKPQVGGDARGEQRFTAAKTGDEHWRWRMQMVEKMAEQLDARRFGVKAMYVIGSTKNATADPSSDIDLIVHVHGSPQQQETLLSWFEGWSLALAELNYQRTGHRMQKLLDVRLITDEDIASKRSDFAAKIGAATDAAKEVKLKFGK